MEHDSHETATAQGGGTAGSAGRAPTVQECPSARAPSSKGRRSRSTESRPDGDDLIEDGREALVSLAEAAHRTGRHPEVLRRWCTEGRIPGVRLGRMWALRRDTVAALAQHGRSRPRLRGQSSDTAFEADDLLEALSVALKALEREAAEIERSADRSLATGRSGGPSRRRYAALQRESRRRVDTIRRAIGSLEAG